MKSTRRILSVLLAVVILASAISAAVAEDTTDYQVGDHIQFGTYPQKRVEETPKLKAAAEAATWKSYGYYEGTGTGVYPVGAKGDMVPCDYMWFADFFCNGSKYRAVKLLKYRPGSSSGKWGDVSETDGIIITDEETDPTVSTAEELTATPPVEEPTTEVPPTVPLPLPVYTQQENGYTTNNIYYFKYEPLVWRVLDTEECFIFCESLIDAQAYQNTFYSIPNDTVEFHVGNPYAEYWYYQDNIQSTYANDYAKSSIRTWLNYDFYETAFTADQKANIKTTELDNSAAGTGSAQFDSAATNDKIFLLSDGDIRNTAYGFSSAAETRDAARTAKRTDYALCQGLHSHSDYNPEYSGNFDWWLRTPASNSIGSLDVWYDGRINTGSGSFVSIIGGIRPACNLSELTSDVTLSELLFSKGNSSPDPYDLTTEPSAEFSTEPSSEPSTDSDIQPTTVPSTVLTTADENTSEGTPKPAFFQRIIQWFRNLFAKLFGKE